ncbi:glycoside hydrolase family 3 N-terminal domain-containing protein [Pseudomarimonas salicorniae]
MDPKGRPEGSVRAGRDLTLGLALLACVGGFATPVPVTAMPGDVAVTPELWPRLESPMARDPVIEQRVDSLLAKMSLEDKVGQVVQGDLDSLTPEDLRKYRLGSVLAGGNSDPGKRYNAPAADWLKLADALHEASVDTSAGGPGIPVLLGIDAVHGHNNVVGATLFPHNIGLGAANDAELVRRIAEATAVELRATGFEWTFAPTVTTPRDDRWGRTYEGYSEDPALVARYATAVVEGLQGPVGSKGFLGADRVVSTAKHYIGDGGTFEGRDKGDTRVTEVELRDVHGAGHIAALKAGVQSIMASFSSWNGLKMHGHHGLLTVILKERLGFDGFVVGDWNGHGEVEGCTDKSCPQAFNAGVDMYMAPDTWREVYTNTLAQVRDGTIPMARLDDAVRRILRVKLRFGLFEAPLPSARKHGGDFEVLGSPGHRALAREAVRRSLVLLKNEGVLPLDPRKRLLVAGDGADDIARQSGGWTLTWQGTGTTRADFPRAQTIWEGLREAVEASGGQAELAADGRYATRPDAAVVVFGEAPYAEFIGDVPHLGYQVSRPTDLALIRRLKAEGIPVVGVFLSGRPMWVNREINAADAFVAAWLPGSEGGGVADVLLADAKGEVRHDFAGRLPFSWPRHAMQTPLNAGQVDYHPQFPLGFGLSYASPAATPPLSEEAGLERLEQGAVDVFFARGNTADGWQWWVGDGEQRGAAPATLPSRDLAKALELSAVDHLAQEDARRIRWKGGARGRAWLESEQSVDLASLPEERNTLVATLRLAAPPQGPVTLSVGGTPLRIDALLATLPAREWVEVGFPLSCFAEAGAPLGAVRQLFGIDTEGQMELSVSKVALGAPPARVLECITE